MIESIDLIGCHICGVTNSPESKYCKNCLSRIDVSTALSVEEALELQASIALKKKRKRIIKTSLITIVFVFVSLFLVKEFMFPYALSPTPSGNLSTFVGDDNWAKKFRDIYNSNYIDERLSDFDGRIFEVYQSTEALSSPVIDINNIYLSSKAGYVIAIDKEDFTKKWEFNNRGPIDQSPIVVSGQAFWGLRDGSVISVDSETGEEKWVHKSEGYKTYPLSLHSGIVFAASGDNKLYALDAENGQVLWKYDAGDLIVGGVALVKDVVVLNTAKGYVNVIDIKSGKRKFFVKVQGVSGAPFILNEKVVVGDNRGYIYEIDIDNRAYPFERAFRWIKLQLWAWGAIGPLGPPRGLDRVSYFEDINFSSSISSNQDSLFALSIPLHKCDINSYIVRENPRTALDKKCAFGSLGRLHSIKYDDLSLNWTYQTDRSRNGAFFTEAPLILNNVALIGDGSGLLHVVDLETGDSLSSHDFGEPIVQSPVYSNGYIYVVTQGGSLYSIQISP